MQFKRFPDFGKELRRPFPVAEECYDCGEFYDGCNAWPASKPWRCADYLQLPDVMPGTHGQVFPPSRMQGRKEPRELPASDRSRARSRRSGGPRRCGCGAVLPKGKRLCGECRARNRRQSQRQYMRTYMQQRRSAETDAA